MNLKRIPSRLENLRKEFNLQPPIETVKEKRQANMAKAREAKRKKGGVDD